MHFSSVWICNETVQSSLVAWNLQNFKSVGDWSVEYMRACIFKCIMACVVYTVVLQNCWASRVFLDHALIYIACILVKYKTKKRDGDSFNKVTESNQTDAFSSSLFFHSLPLCRLFALSLSIPYSLFLSLAFISFIMIECKGLYRNFYSFQLLVLFVFVIVFFRFISVNKFRF